MVREKIRITEEQYANHWKYKNHEILEETAQESFLSLIESQQKEEKMTFMEEIKKFREIADAQGARKKKGEEKDEN